MFLMVINVLHICGKNSTNIALDKLISSEIPVKYSEKENLSIVKVNAPPQNGSGAFSLTNDEKWSV